MASESKLGGCAQVFRLIFLIFDLIFLAVGIVVFSFGIYLQVTSQNYSFITGSDYVSLAAVFIVSGLITGIIAAVGFVGACLKWRPLLLVIFAITLGILILLEIITGATAFYFRGRVADESSVQYRTRLNDAIREYRLNPDDPSYNENVNDALNYLQRFLECCGTDKPSDWGELNGDYIFENSNNGAGQLPSSCDCQLGKENCGRVSFPYTYNSTFTMTYNGTVWTQGCVPAVQEYVHHNLISLGAGAVSFVVLQILTVIFTISLCACIISKKKRDRNTSRVQDLAYTPLEAYPTYPTNIFDPQHHSNQNCNQFHDDDDDDGNVKMV